LTENSTPEFALRIRIVSEPDPDLFAEYDVHRYRVGDVHEVPTRLATLLILSGYAERVGGAVPAAEAADFSGPRFPRRKK